MFIVTDPLIKRRLRDLARELGLNNEEEVITYLLNNYSKYKYVSDDYGQLVNTADPWSELKDLCSERNKLLSLLNILSRKYASHCIGVSNVEELRKIVSELLSLCTGGGK